MTKNTSFFHKKLIQWYLRNKRDLPWRATQNPYFIWLSEVMLQQTRVAQGLPYYYKFVEVFPTIEHLANVSEEKVLKSWQGLGYYSRARNLHSTAKYITENLGGIFPNTYVDLLKLKGIGDYTASAIASICFNEATAVVDGNVYRVLARFFDIETPINSSAGVKEFKLLAQQLIDPKQPGTYNQAIMEFGARQCAPQNPDCVNCIFNDNCLALAKGKVSQLPVKLGKTRIRKRYFNYIVSCSEDQKTIIRQRLQKGIWQKLYEFPLIETEAEISWNQMKRLQEYTILSEALRIESLTLYNEISIVHKLSHQHLYTRFWIAQVSVEHGDELQPEEIRIPIAKVRNYAVPILIENFISDFSPFKI
jgi:A/G-specific adenine glycosylase